MAQDRTELHKPAAIVRRPVAAATVHRSATAAASVSPAQALQRRLGNQGTQALISRSTAGAAQVSRTSPVSAQFARVSQPNDPAEIEARDTARKVVNMSEPAKPQAAKADQRVGKPLVQRDAVSVPAAPISPAVGIAPAGGSPLPSGVRSFMEPRFGADFGNVRIHTGESAAQQSAQLSAYAFTVGEHVFFGRDQFQPHSAGGRELIAHELTHTVQQGAVVQRSEDTTVSQRAPVMVQRFGISDALDWIADKANYIPGFRLLTIVLGVNPINMSKVDRNAANLLRALLELVPVIGPLIVQALDSYGIFAKVGAWFEVKVKELGLVGSALKGALTKFLDSLSWSDIFDLGGVWDRAKSIFTEPIDRLLNFGKSVASDIIGFVRQAILLPLAKLAEGTRGYDLLKAVLGEDPVTGEPVPRNAETLIGGFMKLIGQEDVWENIKKSNAIPRAWAWFQGALSSLLGFLKQIPTLFINALKALEIIDLILPWKAFGKIAGVFGGFAVEFVSWAGHAVWNLLEIIFDVVSPGALFYIKKTGAALKSILKNPLPFVRNLVKAAKLGFSNFAEHFLTHLQAKLIDWLTGSLPGIYIPKAFSLMEIGKFVFSVLGLSWANIRVKLVKVMGETAVKAMETGFDIVVTLVRDGPAAAWDKIKEQLSNLKDMVIGGITDFVVDMVVKKAIPRLISMFIPGAGFITAILSIYDTIMVFVRKISKIIEVVKGFIDSIVDIAGGAIDSAAKGVETTLANLLSLAISFLAGFAGIDKVSEKVMAVIEKIRAPIDKALDWLVNWIVTMAKGLFAQGKALVKKALGWALSKGTFTDAEGAAHSVYVDDSANPPRLMIASTPTGAKIFLQDWIKTRPKEFQDANGAKIATATTAIAAAEAQAGVIAKAQAAGKTDQQLAPEFQKLLSLNVAVGAALSALINDDRDVGTAQQKYLLEGLGGTYGSMPKPPGDKFTADHQPQAAILEVAAEFTYFTPTGEMAKRAERRAHAGYAVNIFHKRHTAGRTYGKKGSTTKASFLQTIKAQVMKLPTPAAQQKAAVGLIRKELMEDVNAMKDVVKDDKNFEDIRELKLPDKKEKALIKEIRDRIIAGENQVAAQDLDSLVQ